MLSESVGSRLGRKVAFIASIRLTAYYKEGHLLGLPPQLILYSSHNQIYSSDFAEN